jgi:hypothetical protein
VVKAFSWLLTNSKPLGFIAVHGFGNLDGVIREVIGDATVKNLRRQGKVIVSGVEVSLITERKLIYDGKNSPMVAFYPDSKFLDEIDSIPNISAMLVVPWLFKEVEPWIRAWNASELGQPPTTPKSALLQSKIVEQALKGLTSTVNLSTGISHPSDRDAAIQMFEILKAAGEPFSPDEIKAWLVGKGGWKATDAQEVADIAQKVIEGRRLKTDTRVWAHNILEIWEKDAQRVPS